MLPTRTPTTRPIPAPTPIRTPIPTCALRFGFFCSVTVASQRGLADFDYAVWITGGKPASLPRRLPALLGLAMFTPVGVYVVYWMVTTIHAANYMS
jgi:hypothetical protein